MDINKIEEKQKKWQAKKQFLIQKQQIKKEKRAIKSKSNISTSKIIIAFLLINCTCIEIFTCFITLLNLKTSQGAGISPDFTPLITLISTVVGEIISFAIYAVKSMKENTQGGIIYETAMLKTLNPELNKTEG